MWRRLRRVRVNRTPAAPEPIDGSNSASAPSHDRRFSHGHPRRHRPAVRHRLVSPQSAQVRSSVRSDRSVGGGTYSRPIALRNPIVFLIAKVICPPSASLLFSVAGSAAVRSMRVSRICSRAGSTQTEQSAVPRSGASTAWPSRDESPCVRACLRRRRPRRAGERRAALGGSLHGS